MVDLDDFEGYQHRGSIALSISEAAFPLADGTGTPQIRPDLVALGLGFPNAELRRVPPQDFLAGEAAPIHEGIVHQHVLLVAHPPDHNQDGTPLKGRAEARFT